MWKSFTHSCGCAGVSGSEAGGLDCSAPTLCPLSSPTPSAACWVNDTKQHVWPNTVLSQQTHSGQTLSAATQSRDSSHVQDLIRIRKLAPDQRQEITLVLLFPTHPRPIRHDPDSRTEHRAAVCKLLCRRWKVGLTDHRLGFACVNTREDLVSIY